MENYLSTERPLYFDYQKEISHDYNYSNWKELLDYLRSNFDQQLLPSKYLAAFHSFTDNKNSERVYKEILKRLS